MLKQTLQSIFDTISGGTTSGNETAIRKARNKEIVNSILVLSATVVRCDKNYTTATEEYIRQYLDTNIGDIPLSVTQAVNTHLISGTEPFTKIACTELVLLTTYESRLSILRFLFGVAAVDDFVNANEKRMLHRIAKYLSVSEADFSAVQSDFVNKNNPYAVLGLDDKAEFAEVKSAYRKLLLKYHPDKVKEENSQTEAKKRFEAIQQAFLRIQTDRKSKD